MYSQNIQGIKDAVYWLFCVSVALHIVFIHKGTTACPTITQHTVKTILVINRLLQCVLMVAWLWLEYGNTFGVGPYWLPGLICMAVGQFINFMVYYRIGVDGVYYGREYDIVSGPFCTSFPFTIPHPMYVGCILTIVGLFVLTGFNQDLTVRPPAVMLMMVMLLEIIASMYIEHKYIAISHA